MLRFLVLIAASFCILGCSPKSETSAVIEEVVTDTVSVVEVFEEVTITTPEAYRDRLAELPTTPQSIITGLELFAKTFDKSNSTMNDKALFYYIEFQSKVMAQLDKDVAGHPDIESINNIAYGDSSVTSKGAWEYMRTMDENGLKFGVSEGYVFVKRKPEVIEQYFYSNLTDGTKEFFKQFAKESDQELASDAGIIIPIRDVADRIVFWDLFLSRYPDHVFSNYAYNELKSDRYYLMSGMENTPAYDYETKKVNPEFASSFEYITGTYPNTKSGNIFKGLLAVLVKNDSIRTEEVDNYIGKYSPW